MGRGSVVSDVDRSGQRGSEGVELNLEAGVVGAGMFAPHQVPDRVPSELSGFLDFWGLGVLDRSGGEVVLAGGDLNPNVDGGDLAFSAPNSGRCGPGTAGSREISSFQVR